MNEILKPFGIEFGVNCRDGSGMELQGLVGMFNLLCDIVILEYVNYSNVEDYVNDFITVHGYG